MVEESDRDVRFWNDECEFRIVVDQSLAHPTSESERTAGKQVRESVERVNGGQGGRETRRSVAFQKLEPEAKGKSVGSGVEFSG